VVKSHSEAGGVLQIRTTGVSGPLIAEIKIPRSTDWKITKAPVVKFKAGIQNLFVTSKGDPKVEVDWIRFE
jgi:hypothetical protein